jgi:hypothetical protein
MHGPHGGKGSAWLSRSRKLWSFVPDPALVRKNTQV